ncbi:MAG: M28 family peptidase [Chlorobi bacterium]|nr:M28 family peptidase [Chlorobiota bacterium]
MAHRSIMMNIFILLFLVPFIAGCPEDVDPQANRTDTTSISNLLPDPAGIPSFSAQAAYDHIAKQVTFGTREPNSPGAQKAIAYYLEELGKYADEVRPQKFTHTGYNGTLLNLTNIVASFNLQATTRILLCAHWDSRPRADWDPDSSRQNQPILAANDGGSGVGVLLELARILKENSQPIGIDILLFDGEDYGHSRIDGTQQYFLGSRYFSQNLPAGYQPIFGMLLDMVGDKDAEFPKEGHSMQYASAVVEKIWSAAAHLGLSKFKQRYGSSIEDDHLMLNQIARIPTIDIIDTDLVGHNSPDPRRRYWHTHKDTMDNIGVETLEQVGKLLVYTIYKLIPAELNQTQPS